jgi:hypothetical protein
MELAAAPLDVFAAGPNQEETDCSCIFSENNKTIPDNSREVSDIYELVGKVKQNIDTAIFTIDMAEVANFLEILFQKLKYQNQFRASQWLYKWRRRLRLLYQYTDIKPADSKH